VLQQVLQVCRLLSTLLLLPVCGWLICACPSGSTYAYFNMRRSLETDSCDVEG
jgi:hypothetical protein